MKTSIEISLKHPVTLPDKTVLSTLTMRRPTALDVLASQESSQDETDRSINLLANLCMVTPEAFDELAAADFASVNDAFEELSTFEPLKAYNPGESISLNVPITVNDAPMPALTLRCPKVKDIKAARKTGGSDAAQECELFAALAGVTSADIRKLDWADYRKLKTIYGDFLA